MTSTSSKPRYAVIVGLGRTGLSCARYLHARGWRLAVTDTRQSPPELGRLAEVDAGIPVRVGGLDAGLLPGAELVAASPGVSLAEPFFRDARRRGIQIVGDIELFARAADAPVVGITGTNGKSTVTTLVGLMAARAGLRVRVGGNLGEPALNLLEPASAAAGSQPTQLYVLELSSFQLDATSSLALKAAAVLNVTPDHLDRYASVAEYAAAKARIFERCETAVINLDDPLVVAMPRPGQKTLGFSLRPTAAGAAIAPAIHGRRLAPVGDASPINADYACQIADAGLRRPSYPTMRDGEWWLTRKGEPLLALSAMKIKGLHNAANALAALAIGEALGLDMQAMLEELTSFAGLPHRSQWVADIGGVTYINDSKGTNVGATVAAVQGMQGSLVMIAGGDGKNQDFSELANVFRGKVRHTVLIGRDAAAIARVLAGVCTFETRATLEEAVRAAAKAARPGDTVLLSPACASLDMFRDYTHRGAVFTEAVKELAA